MVDMFAALEAHERGEFLNIELPKPRVEIITKDERKKLKKLFPWAKYATYHLDEDGIWSGMYIIFESRSEYRDYIKKWKEFI